MTYLILRLEKIADELMPIAESHSVTEKAAQKILAVRQKLKEEILKPLKDNEIEVAKYCLRGLQYRAYDDLTDVMARHNVREIRNEKAEK